MCLCFYLLRREKIYASVIIDHEKDARLAFYPLFFLFFVVDVCMCIGPFIFEHYLKVTVATLFRPSLCFGKNTLKL